MMTSARRYPCCAVALVCLVLLAVPSVAAGQGEHPGVEAVRAAYGAIAERHLDGEAVDQAGAFAAGKALLARGLDRGDAEVAAEVLFRGIDLANRLEQRRPMLFALIDSARAYRTTDTSRASRGLFLLAEACVELQRGSFELVRVLADSSLSVGGRPCGTTRGPAVG